MSFLDNLKTRASEQRAALDREQAALAKLVAAERVAAETYERMQAERSFDASYFAPETNDARIAFEGLTNQRQRVADRVRELLREVGELEGRANAPLRLQQARDDLAAARAAVAQAEGKREQHAAKMQRLEAQLQAEREAEAVARDYARELVLSRIEGREPAGVKPAMPPQAHAEAAGLVAELIDAERQNIAALDGEITDRRRAERKAEKDVLEAAAAVAELQFAEGLAAFAPQWSRFVAAHDLAFGMLPTPPDFNELASIGEDEAKAEARQVLLPVEGGIKRTLRRLLGEGVA